MITPSERATNFHYAIRNVVQAAEAMERQGRKITYLNIGDPQAFGFKPPPDVIEAVARATREKFTGYSHSAGLREAREVIARYATALGAKTSPDQTLITSGASEAADLARGHPELGEYMGQIAGPARQLGLREELRHLSACRWPGLS